MTCQEMDARLDDCLDGVLAAVDARSVEAHLASCAACREAERKMRQLLAYAAALPRSVAPPRDLWPDIERAIARERLAGLFGWGPSLGSQPRRRSSSPSPRVLWRGAGARRADGRDPVRGRHARAGRGSLAASPTPRSPQAEREYESAAKTLLEALQQRRSRARPRGPRASRGQPAGDRPRAGRGAAGAREGPGATPSSTACWCRRTARRWTFSVGSSASRRSFEMHGEEQDHEARSARPRGRTRTPARPGRPAPGLPEPRHSHRRAPRSAGRPATTVDSGGRRPPTPPSRSRTWRARPRSRAGTAPRSRSAGTSAASASSSSTAPRSASTSRSTSEHGNPMAQERPRGDGARRQLGQRRGLQATIAWRRVRQGEGRDRERLDHPRRRRRRTSRCRA